MMTIGRSVGRALLAGLLPIACATLPILAHASPPDPSWIAGIYDDDDYDDVVILVESATGSAAHAAPTGVPPLLRRLELLAPASEDAAAARCPSALHSRAPPTS